MIIPNSRSSSQCIHTYMHVIYEHICLQLTGRYVYFQKHAICLMVPLVILFCSEDKQRQHTLIMLSSFILVADQLKMYTLFQSQPWFHILYIIQCGCCCFFSCMPVILSVCFYLFSLQHSYIQLLLSFHLDTTETTLSVSPFICKW